MVHPLQSLPGHPRYALDHGQAFGARTPRSDYLHDDTILNVTYHYGREQGIDIRTVGSRNAGSLNTFHQVGPAAAGAVLVADVSKGVVAVFLPLWVGAPDWASYGSAVAVVAGHNWPVFLGFRGFRGGKGAATVLGVSLAVVPLITLIALTPTVLLALLAGNLVMGATLGFILINLLTVITGQGWTQVLLCLLLTFVVTATYLGRSWQQSLSAARQRRWLDLFSFE